MRNLRNTIFYMKILQDFHICISVPLTKMIVKLIIADPLNRVINQKYNSCKKNPDPKLSHITFTSRKWYKGP